MAATRARRRGDRVRRREVSALLGAGVMWPLAAAGQQPAKVWRVAQVLFGAVATTGVLAAALEKRLAELGDDRLAVVTNRYLAPDPKIAETEIAALSREIDLLVVWSTIGGGAATRVRL